MKYSLGLILLLTVLMACKTVPISGRKQLALLPSGQMNTMSFSNYQKVLSSSRIDNSSREAKLVQRVGRKISLAVENYLKDNKLADRLEGFSWEFNTIVDDAVNAWCMPGGKVAFYTGIFPICKDETGIAVVMGHEIAHAIAKHGNERMTQGLAQQLGGMALTLAIKDKPEQTQKIFNTAYGLGTTYGAILPFSRLHESEADEMGLMFMAMAGYDPRQAPKLWERMAANSGGNQPPVFLSTHPSHAQRIARLNEAMPRAMKLYR